MEDKRPCDADNSMFTIHINIFFVQASTYPTVVIYVMDSARSTNPVTFMSNMLYACSILYRTKLPFIVVLNKVIFSK